MLGIVLFMPAWTLNYWQAWVFIVVFTTSANAIGVYLSLKEPAMLRRVSEYLLQPRFCRQDDRQPQNYGTKTRVTIKLSIGVLNGSNGLISVVGAIVTNKTLLSLVNLMPCHRLSARFQPSDFNLSL